MRDFNWYAFESVSLSIILFGVVHISFAVLSWLKVLYLRLSVMLDQVIERMAQWQNYGRTGNNKL